MYFSNPTNVFVSVAVFPFNMSLGFLLLFWHQKQQYHCDKSLLPFWLATNDHLSDGFLFVQSSCWIFSTERLYWQNMIFYNHFLLYRNRKQKKIRYAYFSKNSLNFKKTSTESDQHWIPVQKRKQLVLYQLLPNLAIWEP